MSLGTPLAVVLAILFLIPGFIWKKVADVASPYAKPAKVELLECLMLSCINYLLASIPIYFLLRSWPETLDLGKPGTIVQHVPYLGVWLLLIFALPVLGGVGTAKLLKRGFFRRFGISVLHPAPTAWDYTFARDESYWAIVELTDGDRVVGLFDSNSLASSESGERDIFLETLYEWNEQHQTYEQLGNNEGILIRGDQIRTVTFFSTEEEEGADELEEPDPSQCRK